MAVLNILKKVAGKYNDSSLIIRILIGIVIGVILRVLRVLRGGQFWPDWLNFELI